MVHRAKLEAARTQQTRYVVSMELGDFEGTREQTVVSEEYVDSDEFAAFDGGILCVVAPDGSVDFE